MPADLNVLNDFNDLLINHLYHLQVEADARRFKRVFMIQWLKLLYYVQVQADARRFQRFNDLVYAKVKADARRFQQFEQLQWFNS